MSIAFVVGYMVANPHNQLPLHTESTEIGTSPSDVLNLPQKFALSQFQSPFERNTALLKLLDLANTSELQQYWQQSETMKSRTFQAEIQRSIVQRYAALDPGAALLFVESKSLDSLRPDLIEYVFREWSLQNLEEAKQALRKLAQPSLKIAVTSIVRTRDDLSFSQLREFARQFDFEWIVFEVISQKSDRAILAEPADEWYQFVKNRFDRFPDLSFSESRILSYLTYFWILNDGVDVLNAILETLPEDYSPKSMTEFVARKLLPNHPELALNFGSDLLNRDSDGSYRDLVIELFESRVKLHPLDALKATLNIEALSFRRELQTHLLQIAAQSDGFDLLTSLYSLPESMHELAREVALSEMAIRSPKVVSTMLRDIDDIEQRERLAEIVVANWAYRDIRETLNWIQSDGNVIRIRENLIRQALESLTLIDPKLALQTAIELPLNSDNLGWEETVFQELMTADSDMAISVLPQMRPGSTRREAYDWAILYITIDENDVNAAMDLLIKLCEVEPSEHYILSGIPFMVAEGPKEVFERIDEVPSALAKAKLAKALLDEYKDSEIFSIDEVNKLANIQRNRPPTVVSPEFIEATREFYRLQQESKKE